MAFAPQPAFAPKPEFEFISALLGEKRSAAANSAMGLGPGDDACLLPQADGTHLAVSTDASVEGVHFRFDWASPAEALRKAVLSNLSDINAMGGKTTQLYLCLGAPAGWGLPEAAALGTLLREMEAEHGFMLAGGDTVRVQHECFFAITVLGQVTGRPLLRSAVEPGDTLYVSGHLGASAAGLQLLLQGGVRDDNRSAKALQAVAAHLRPEPPLNLGPALSALAGAKKGRRFAAIDLSDGLSSELWHLSRQSACRIEVDWSKLPYDPALAELVGPDGLKDSVLNGGEEYQLVFAGRFSNAELEDMRRIVPVTAIGMAFPGEGVYLDDGNTTPSLLPAGGYSH